MKRVLVIGVLVASAAALPAENEAGFRPLYNGRDLTGWVRVNTAPETFVARDDEIITTGRPMGFLRTDRQYENFVCEFDWMHDNRTEVGNSGFFVWGDPLPAVGTVYTRGIEVQVLVNLEWKDKKTGQPTATSHGDLFSIWGASCVPDRPHPLGWERCIPSEMRAKGGGEWNHYRIEANNGRITLAVNGKEVTGVKKCHPRKGYLALESEGAKCHFRNLKIKELPSTNPKPEDCAATDKGHKPIFDGLTRLGWTTEGNAWKVANENLKAVGKADLVSQKAYGPGGLIFDWKAADGKYRVTAGGKETTVTGKAKEWNRAEVTVGGSGPIRFPAAEGLELKNLFFRAN